MNVTEASSILRPIPPRPVQRAYTPEKNPVAKQVQAEFGATRTPATAASMPPHGVTATSTRPLIETDTDETKPDRLKALLDDWGKTDSPHDLNGDGTVGIQDMLQLLEQMAKEHYQPPDPETNPLQALLDDWGMTDSPHDLNGDGTVGIQDMLQLLSEMTHGTHDEPTDPNKASLQALLDAWGKTGSAHDLNGDGTVGIQDMLQLLSEMTQTTDEPDKDDTNNQQKRLDRLIADWGKKDSQFDLDGNGTVGIRDMLMLLARMASHRPQAAQASQGVPAEPESLMMAQHAKGFAHYARTSAMHLADSLMEEMREMEPGEIRESIRRSRLPDMQKRFVLDHLAASRQHRQRISLVG